MTGPPRRLAAAAAALLCTAAAPCTTIVLPTGLGVSAPTAIESLHPMLTASSAARQVSHMLLRPLLRLTPDYTVDFARSLASGIEVLDGGRRYRVTLHPWQWSDGVKLTADDVAYAFQVLRGIGQSSPSYGNGGVPDLVAAFTVLDPARFEISMTRAVNPEWFTLNGLNQIVPLPRHAWKSISADEMWARQSDPALFAVASGPFVLDRFNIGRSITLTPNRHFPGRQPRYSRLVMNFLEGADAFGAFAAGELDVSNLPYALAEHGRAIPGAHVVATHPSFNYYTLTLNHANAQVPFLRDARVRQAMADALDQPGLVRMILHGFGAPLYGPVPAQPASFQSPAARAGRFPVGYDPDRARALLREAGYRPGNDGIARKDGRRLAFTALIPTDVITGLQEAQFFQHQLALIGIALHLRLMEFNQIVALLLGPSETWQAAFLSFPIEGYPDGKQNFATDGGLNVGHYSDQTHDKLADAVNFGTGREPLFAWQDYVTAQQPSIFFTNGTIPVIARDGIEGVRDAINPNGDLFPEELSITDADYCHAARRRTAS